MTRKYSQRDATQLTNTKRKCRKCKEKGKTTYLKSNRYFDCEICVPELPTDNGDWDLHDWDIGEEIYE